MTDDGTMPLLDHLVELRQRLFYSAIGFVIAFGICLYFSQELFNFLIQPLAALWADEPGRRIIFTALHEQFFTQIRIAFFTAAFFAFPVVAMQVWMFVAPGLYKNEKRAFLPFLVATPILFFLGAALLYYIVLPVAWQFFVSFEQSASDSGLAVESLPSAKEYLNLSLQLIFAFGLAFELPVVLILLTRAGLVSIAALRKQRRYAIVLAFVAAAILTPPDPVSQVGLALPIILLYELSIVLAAAWERKRAREGASS